jgi:hypothetical protein
MNYLELREGKDLTREGVASELTKEYGIETDVDFLKRLETKGLGERFDYKLKVLICLADIYQVPVSTLLFDKNLDELNAAKVVQLQKEIQILRTAMDNFDKFLKKSLL